MKADQLLDVLKLLKPGLSNNDFVPVLSHYCFTEESVHAFNDLIALHYIFTDEAPKISGALHGDTLLQILGSMGGTEIKLQEKDDVVLIKTGKSRIKLPSLPIETFLFKDPLEDMPDPEIILDEEFAEAVRFCMLSITDSPLQAFEMGITYSNGCLYATDDRTISFVDVKSVDPSLPPILFPTQFCEQIVALYKYADGAEICVNDDQVAVELNKSLLLFSKLPYKPEAKRLIRAIEDNLPDNYDTFEIPTEMESALKRCAAVLHGELEKTVLFEADKEGFSISAEGKYGNVLEDFDVSLDKERVFRIDLESLRKAVDSCFEMSFFDHCIGFFDKNKTHLISHWTDHGDTKDD